MRPASPCNCTGNTFITNGTVQVTGNGALGTTTGATSLRVGTAAGSSATVRIYGMGGVGSSWTRYTGQGTQTFPAGTITGLAYSTTYYVVWTGSAY